MNSNVKGKVGERELARKLTKLFGEPCRRGQQYCGASGDADIIGLPSIHIECKRDERLNLYKAVEQAVADAKDGDIPIVCHRKNNQPWLVTMRLDELPDVVVKLYLTLASD